MALSTCQGSRFKNDSIFDSYTLACLHLECHSLMDRVDVKVLAVNLDTCFVQIADQLRMNQLILHLELPNFTISVTRLGDPALQLTKKVTCKVDKVREGQRVVQILLILNRIPNERFLVRTLMDVFRYLHIYVIDNFERFWIQVL